jgi:hypothetical protein
MATAYFKFNGSPIMVQYTVVNRDKIFVNKIFYQGLNVAPLFDMAMLDKVISQVRQSDFVS